MEIDKSAAREWSRNFVLHEPIPAPEEAKKEPVSSPFFLRITSFEGGNYQFGELRFSLSLYFKKGNSFLGRTFRFGSDLVTYYHSPLKNEEVEGVCEVLWESESGIFTPVGWCKLFCFSEGDQYSYVYSGSPRELVHLSKQEVKQGLYLYYTVSICDQLKNVFDILPANCFCGPHEVLPGLEGRHLPRSAEQPIYLSESSTLNVNDISIENADVIDRKVVDFGNKWREDNYGVSDNRKPKINERRILLGQHNTWCYLGGSGPESAALLRPTSFNTLEASSIVTIKRAIRDPLVALVFELEYSLTVPRKAGESEDYIRITVSWAYYVGQGQGEFEIRMQTGPGRSVSGKILWEPQGALDLILSFSLSSGDASTSNISITHQPKQDIERIKRDLEREKQRELKKLQDELAVERNRQASSKVVEIEPPPPVPKSEVQVQTLYAEPEELAPQYESHPDYSYLDAVGRPKPFSEYSQEFAVLPVEMPRALTRADKARLVRAGVRGLMDHEEVAPVYRPRLDVEAQDPLKASNFIFQFLAYRPPLRGSELPERVFFGLKFYTFAHMMSEVGKIRQGEKGAPWVIDCASSDQEIVIKFEVEPCSWDELDFAKYLLQKNLTVEIWDAESHMHIGNARVHLVEALRQGKPSAVVTKEFPVFKDDNQIGSLQLLIRNQGVSASVRAQPSQCPKKLSGAQARHKYKVRAKEIQMDQAQKPLPVDDEDSRKKLRIIEYKKAKNLERKDEYWEKDKQIQELNMVRQAQKPMVIKQAIREYLSTAEKIHARAGKAFAFQYLVKNPQNTEECFTVVCDDSELSVVKEASEWQWWVSRQDFDRPSEYDMITEDNSIILRPGESCPVIFKFLSWEPKPKMISAWVHQSKAGPLCALELEIVPEAAPIDHTFRYYESENRTVKLCVPPLFGSQKSLHKPILRCTLPKSIVQWESESEISVELKVPPAPKVISFNILAYEDPYASEVKANWEVKLHSYVGVDVNVTTGQTTSLRLACPGDEARTVKLYSSHPKVVSFSAPHDQPFTLLPRSVNSLPVVVRSDSTQIQRVRVHCVDIYHKRLVHAWVLTIQSSASSINTVYEIKAKVGQDSTKKIVFMNRSQSWAMFHFRSSHPNVLEVREPRMGLEGGAKGYLPVYIPAVHQPSLAEVCVFASDTEENIFEVIMFKIEYE